MSTWDEVLRSKPLEAILAFAVLTAVSVVAALLMRRHLRRATSLRHIVLSVALAALALGILAALAAARLMLLDATQAWTFVSVLGMAAGFSALLAVLVAQPLGEDVSRLEATVRHIEAGDRQVRTNLDRADELGHVARALDDLVGQLDRLEREREAVDRERRAVLSAIGHDLRTPLAALRAAVEALSDGIAPDPQRYLAAMEHDLAALSDMVDNLFLLARIDAGTLDLDARPVDLAALVEETALAMAPVASRQEVHLRVPPADAGHPRVLGDPRAVARVLRNLLDNALRYAPAGSTVEVTLETASGDGSARQVIRVSDEGPGFPAEFVDHAFEPLSRADPARTRATGGSGLGLAIARGIVTAHGGDIWIEPGAGPSGASVAFALPLASPSPAATSPSSV